MFIAFTVSNEYTIDNLSNYNDSFKFEYVRSILIIYFFIHIILFGFYPNSVKLFRVVHYVKNTMRRCMCVCM